MQGLMPALDPRTKLFLMFLAAVLVVAASSLTAVILICGMLLVGPIATASFRAYGRWLVLVLPMALFFGLVTGLTFTPGTGLISCLKLLGLTSAGFLFFSTTAPEDLANALIKSGLPFTAAFVMSAGMQFVPVLGRKAKEILDAQKVRGIPLKLGWRLFRQFPALAMPLLVQAFQLAEELAEAMESRGFGRPGRTYYKSFRLGIWDYSVMAAGALATGLLFILMRSA